MGIRNICLAGGCAYQRVARHQVIRRDAADFYRCGGGGAIDCGIHRGLLPRVLAQGQVTNLLTLPRVSRVGVSAQKPRSPLDPQLQKQLGQHKKRPNPQVLNVFKRRRLFAFCHVANELKNPGRNKDANRAAVAASCPRHQSAPTWPQIQKKAIAIKNTSESRAWYSKLVTTNAPATHRWSENVAPTRLSMIAGIATK